MSAFAIRRARKSDAAAIAGLANRLGQQEGGSGRAMSAEIVVADFLSETTPFDVLVAEGSDGVIAYAMHHPCYETAYAARGRYIADLFVAAEARRQGIATALIAEVARLARAEGGDYVWWLASRAGEDARALYARLANIDAPVTSYVIAYEAFDKMARR